MKLPGYLFIKIFIGFWLVTTAILGSWMLTSQYFDARPDGEQAGPMRPGPPHRFVLRLMYDMQTLDDAKLQALLIRTEDEHGIVVYLLDRQGEDLLDRPVPPAVKRLAQELRGGRRRAFHNAPGEHMLAHTVYRGEQGLLRAVLVFPPDGHGLLRALGSMLWLRIALAILVSGIICYLLSRLMTNRLKALQLASRRLANGELDTRLQVRDKGGDETDELARDFNSMAQQLQERIQAQKRLLGDVSHELRSPLARLRIALALAQENSVKSGEYLQRIEHEAERLEELIAQLLATQADKIHLDTHIDLVPLLQHLCADASFEGQAQGVQVIFTAAIEQAIVASSGDLLHKSFENILRNAVNHTDENSCVTVSLAHRDGSFHVAIEDRGPGVPPEELDKIFGEFYRVDTARTRDSGGYGLGLAIARRAILRHGGGVEAANTGSGLLVTVSLPAHT
jgi:two-component system sensor histidine kinase CpxA